MASVSSYLGRDVEIQVRDGRRIAGRLAALDRAMNAVLAECTEFESGTTGEARGTFRGMLMVPGKLVERVMMRSGQEVPLSPQVEHQDDDRDIAQ